MEPTFQEVVKEYRRQTDKSVRGFAEYLTENIVNTTLSGQTISRWETEKNVAPDLYLLLNIFTTYTDTRMYFAVDSLKAILPHVFDSGMVTFHLPKSK
jgi:transcriptional regulator with XRE-family HTH domain